MQGLGEWAQLFSGNSVDALPMDQIDLWGGAPVLGEGNMLDEESPVADQLVNAVEAALLSQQEVQGAEGRQHQHPGQAVPSAHPSVPHPHCPSPDDVPSTIHPRLPSLITIAPPVLPLTRLTSLRPSEFVSARREEELEAYWVQVHTQFEQGESMCSMLLTCWVHDDENPIYGEGSGYLRVTELSEDPGLYAEWLEQ